MSIIKLYRRAEALEKKMTFNDDAKNYEAYRPGYPHELFLDIIDYSKNPIDNALEIGAGTGQATQYFANTKINITAIDIGENMVNDLSDKFKDRSNVNCICSSFEDYKDGGKKFDLVYSATAFHWIDAEYGLTKIKSFLNENGVIALFWNHPFVGRSNDKVHCEIRKVYDKYRPTDKSPKEFSAEDTEKYVNLLNEFGFKDVKAKLYHRERQFNADEYIGLLNTYSDHRLLPPDIKAEFEDDIYKAIKNNGNEIIVYDTIDLYLGRKS